MLYSSPSAHQEELESSLEVREAGSVTPANRGALWLSWHLGVKEGRVGRKTGVRVVAVNPCHEALLILNHIFFLS